VSGFTYAAQLDQCREIEDAFEGKISKDSFVCENDSEGKVDKLYDIFCRLFIVYFIMNNKN